ncbi:DUF7006 family protein [Enterococcus sp. BWR-S5]|uniref:DUF7006 family protein n=1 Tax=Enterococcus sp. BWR-S5 TaxID=2787714 RepID=UPI001924E908|nr:hypothetical protein [Enterococcus sp. BWR-S5]MBL1226356.1 hypothetical protein [Enterococcus sp. BWR-S5]
MKKWCGLWNSMDFKQIDNCSEAGNPLTVYASELCQQANELVLTIKGENFYEVLPQLMTLDAKLRLVKFYISSRQLFSELSDYEIVKLIDEDYKNAHFEKILNFSKAFEAEDSVLFQIG